MLTVTVCVRETANEPLQKKLVNCRLHNLSINIMHMQWFLSLLCVSDIIQVYGYLYSSGLSNRRVIDANNFRSKLSHTLTTTTTVSSSSSSNYQQMSQYMSSESNDNDNYPEPTITGNGSQEVKSKANVLSNINNLLRGRGWNGTSSTLLTRESIAKLGLNVLLAYGFVSNFSYVTCIILSWVSHGRLYGLSPRAPGQWKSFLLIYSGFFAANNILRPLRFSLSLAISPFFIRLVERIQTLLKVNKAVATACVVFLVNVVGTTSYLVLGLIVATSIAKVPLL